MSQKKSRLARQAARLERTGVGREYNADANKIRARRDEALRKINEEFREEVKRLETARQESRLAVWAKYDWEREQHIKSAAAKDAQAA